MREQSAAKQRGQIRYLRWVFLLVFGISRRLQDFVEGTPVPADMRDRLYLDQASDFAKVVTGRSFVGMNSAGLLFFDFLHAPQAPWRDGLVACLEFSYLFMILINVRWLKRRFASGADAKRHIETARTLLIVLGMLWGLLLNVLVPYGTGVHLALVYGVAVGLIATPVLVSPLSCAVAFWLPVCAGTCMFLLLNHLGDWFAMGDVMGFIVLTAYLILFLNRRAHERLISAIRLEENSQVIKLLLRDFEESASDWLWETNAALEMAQVSQRLAQVAQRPAETLLGPFPQALLGEIMNFEHRPGSAIDRLLRTLSDRSPFRDLVVPVLVNGEERYWSLTGKPILDKFGRFAGYHGVGSDITGQRRQQEQIAFLARHDSLTKLPNRVLFGEALHQACETCGTTGIALLCLDLDHFKVVNDTLGHATGDGVLVAVAERLRGCVREFDLAARLGGDEFAVILVTSDIAEASAIANRIIDRVSRPYHFDGQLVQLGISIGITMAPGDGMTPGTLLKNADLALYRAKTDGRGLWRLYDPEMDERLQGRRALQAALRQALPRQEFRVEYQPIIDFNDRRIIGAEALLRWQHPERGLLGPGEFIALAEESGLIGQIGEFVLTQACATAARWPADITVAVNLSPLQFRDPGLVQMINGALAAAGLPPGRLELEITETTMLETNSQTVDALWALHNRGVRIALDDFGTGYSSLSYLRRFPFDKVKIDRSFIRDLGYEKDDSSIILAIIGLAERMNMLVTAEGVETAEQAELLVSYGCPQAQGYLFYRSMPAAAFSEVMAKSLAVPDWTLALGYGRAEALRG